MDEVTNQEANRLADEILLRSEFLPAREPGFFTRATNRVIQEIADFLGWLFGGLFGTAGSGAGSLIAFVLLAVAVAILGYAIYKAITGRSPRDRDADSAGGTRVVFDEIVDPAELREALARHRAAGDWRAAVIAGFRLAVVALIDDHIASERPGATTGDFGRQVARNRPEMSEVYDAAGASFERSFYSDEPIYEADFDRVQDLLGRLTRISSK